MIKDILDENGNSLIDPTTHIANLTMLGDYIKTDLSNNPNNFTNGIETYIYQDNQWKLDGIYEGSTTGAPIKLAQLGYSSAFSNDTKYRCLQIKPNNKNIFEFLFNGLGM